MKKLLLLYLLINSFNLNAETPGQFIIDSVMVNRSCSNGYDLEDSCTDLIRKEQDYILKYESRDDPAIKEYVSKVRAHLQENNNLLEKFRADKIQKDAEDKINHAKALKAEKERKAKPGVHIGDTADFVINQSQWGKPSKINRTITRNGTHEQWVYGDNNYLYLDNGIVTAIQN